MIRVTRLDRREIVLNCDLVESIEARPDTTIRLFGGATLVVREGVDELLALVRTWRASVLARAGLPGLLAHPLLPALLSHTERDRESDSDHAELEIPA